MRKRLTKMKLGLIIAGLGAVGAVTYFFRCKHRNYTFPQRPQGEERFKHKCGPTGEYVCCLDCGKEFPYDWNDMRMMNKITDRVMADYVEERRADSRRKLDSDPGSPTMGLPASA